jgi:hypothetical protein
MIINNLSSPYKSLYVIGASILLLLRSNKSDVVDPLELYESFKEENPKISLSYFIYGLDWLYMASLVELTESGDITLCS